MKVAHAKISPVMKEFSSYIAGAIKKPLPPRVTERAKVHVVDTFAAMISGSRLLPGKRATSYIRTLGGKATASVIGTRVVTSVPNAVLANGMFAHADETDDTHPTTRTHPGSGVVPAAFAIGERDRLSGTAVLRAVVLGYDVCVRLIHAITELHFRHTGHQPSMFGRLFGAAAAAGALLKLDARQVRFLLSYAAQQASGLSCVVRDTEHVEKAFTAGMPAHNGVIAALVAEQGFTGVEDVFSGKHNLFSTFAPEADLGHLTRGLGSDYEIMRGAIKRWTVGGPIQAPMDVLYDLIRQHGIAAQDVQKLVLEMPINNLMPVDNREMANICVQHLLAVMLLDGTVTFKSAHDFARIKDPRVLALRKRIQAVGTPVSPSAVRSWRCAMEITLKDGRRLARQTTAAKGSFENPITREEEHEKALDLIAPVLGKRRAQELLAALWDLEHVKDVRSLRCLISA